MTTHDPAHDDVVRRSFERQVSLFTGPDSLFAPRPGSTLGWLEPLDADMVVLEVACGAAHVAEQVAPEVRAVVGLDLTPSLLRIGAERLAAGAVRNVVLQEGSAYQLPFVDESFDLVCCRASLHHFDDPARAVTEMARVCRRGGRIVVQDLVAPIPSQRDRFDHLHRLVDPSHVRALLEPELVDLFGGVEALSHGQTTVARFPIAVAFTEQSHDDEVLAQLRAEIAGDEDPTGFDPREGDNGGVEVAFTSCVVHARRG
jgi:ubiquinone/menaquinone biosynthesis C-methylase UbiE